MDYIYTRLEGRITMTTVIARDPSISGHARWETNERAQANLGVEKSAPRCVSAWPLRSQRPVIGLVPRALLRALGGRASGPAVRPTPVRALRAVCGQFGGGVKDAV